MIPARWTLVAGCFGLMAWGIWAGSAECAELLPGRTGAIAVAAALGLLFLGDNLPTQILKDPSPGRYQTSGTQITPGERSERALREYFHAARRDRWPLVLVTACGTLLWAYSDLIISWLGNCS